jgi:hypothetical protein
MGNNGIATGVIATSSGGTWTAIDAPSPANAPFPARVDLGQPVCPAVGDCVSVGTYQSPYSIGVIGVLETLSGGVWTSLEEPLPPDGSTTGTNSELTGVACSASSSCDAVGLYHNTSGGSEGLVERLNG